MSEHFPHSLTISTRHLSADGAQILPGDNASPIEVTIDAALAALRALAAQSAMDLVDVEAKIYLAGPRGKVAVQNVGGKLFATLVPEAANTAAERSPEQVIALLTADESAMDFSSANTAAEQADALADAARRSGGWRTFFTSPWVLVILVIVAATMAYISFGPATPTGVEIVRDPARVASLHAEFNGRYGDPAATVLVLEDGKLTGKRAGATVQREEAMFERTYRFGLRENQVVLLVDNGAVFDAQPDRHLVFLGSSYPRLAK